MGPDDHREKLRFIINTKVMKARCYMRDLHSIQNISGCISEDFSEQGMQTKKTERPIGAKDIKEHITGRFKYWLSLKEMYKQLVIIPPGVYFWKRRRGWYESIHALRLRKNCWDGMSPNGKRNTEKSQRWLVESPTFGPGGRKCRNWQKEGFITQ